MTRQSEKIDFDKLEEQLKSGKKIRLNLLCKMCNGIIYIGEGSVIENEPLHFKCYKEQREKEILDIIDNRIAKLKNIINFSTVARVNELEELKAEIKGEKK